MEFAVIWLIVFIIIAVIFLVILIILRYLKSRRHKLNLFDDDSSGHFFKGVIKRLNPFLIVKKKKSEFELDAPESSESQEGLITFEGKPKAKKQGLEKKEGTKETYVQEKETVFKRESAEEVEGGVGEGEAKIRKVESMGKKIVVDGEEKKRLLEKYKSEMSGVASSAKKGILVRVDNLDALSKKLKDENMAHIMNYLKKEEYSLIEKLFLGKTFESEGEFMEYLKEEIVRFLMSEVILLKDRLSDLRKSGKDVDELSLKVMSVPLKIRLFSASFERKDFDKVILMLNKLDQEIGVVEVEQKESQKREVEKASQKKESKEAAEKPLIESS